MFKKILYLLIIFASFSCSLKADLILPNQKLGPYDVVKIQLEALKNNNKKDEGIMQTWFFAHPDNKKITGPYERFRIMIYGQQYKHLINHSSHKIELIVAYESIVKLKKSETQLFSVIILFLK